MLSLDALTDVRDLSDEQALELAAAIRLVDHMGRYELAASSFPAIDRETWPIDYAPVVQWRKQMLAFVAEEGLSPSAIKAWYRTRPIEFIEHWGQTYDPRNAGTGKPTSMPMLLFKRQRQFVEWILALVDTRTHGLAEKVRDFGLSWLAVFISVWMWSTWTEAPAIGFGSQKEELVDVKGDPKTLFEKIRMAIRALPPFLKPEGLIDSAHLTERNCVNPKTGATIIGEIGDNIGRGGRTLLYWKDEAAHYSHPAMIEAALGDNTNVQIDISTPNGLGNVFHRRRESGELWVPGRAMSRVRASIFIADWREHPGKDQQWYDDRRAKAEAEGLLHKFAQEVDRDYSASVEGTIIKAEWIKSAIGARERLGIPDRGLYRAALDVADGGGDTNALAIARGIELKSADSWGAPDVGVTANKAIDACASLGFVDLQYDSIGVGSGVKAEANRREREGSLPPRLRLVPWNAGAKVEGPDEPSIPGDRDSTLNRDLYYNFKAQAWFRLAARFYRTHRAMEALRTGETYDYNPDDLISLDPALPMLHQIEKELAQATATKENKSQKLVVNKTPEGTKSPNIADSIVMAFNPRSGLLPVYATAPTEVEQTPFKVPPHWKRIYTMKVEPTRTTALLGVHDDIGDILYVIAEYSRNHADAGVIAQGIAAWGTWIPGVMEVEGSTREEAERLMASYGQLGLKLLAAQAHGRDAALEPGITDTSQRIGTGRLKVFSTCTGFFEEYRAYRRDEDGSLLGGGFMDCVRVMARPAVIQSMIVKPPEKIIASVGKRNLYR